jgi:hypothetical protein
MPRFQFTPGQRVAFSQSVLRLAYDQLEAARARGTVVDVRGGIVAVDFHGTWVQDALTGSSVRRIPAGNLVPVLADGAVFRN